MNEEAELRLRVYQKVSEIRTAGDIFDLFGILGYPKGVLHDKKLKKGKQEALSISKEMTIRGCRRCILF